MSFPQLKTCRVSFYLGNGVSLDAIVTGPFANDTDAKREALTRVFHEISEAAKKVQPLLSLDSKPSTVEQMFGGDK